MYDIEKVEIRDIPALFYGIDGPAFSPLFPREVARACVEIEQCLGVDHQVSQFLRDHPPRLMSPEFSEFAHFAAGCYLMNSVSRPGEICVQPDMINYPVALMGLLVHEATHATDPEVKAYFEYSVIRNDDPDALYILSDDKYNIRCNQFISRLEVTAISAELDVLSRISVPSGASAHEARYLSEQQEALTAWYSQRLVCYRTLSAIGSLVEDGLDLVKQDIWSPNQQRNFSEVLRQFAVQCGRAHTDNLSWLERLQEAARIGAFLMRKIEGVEWYRERLEEFSQILAEVFSSLVQQREQASRRDLPPRAFLQAGR